MPIVRLCAVPGCGRVRSPGDWTSRCERHAREYKAKKEKTRSSANPQYRKARQSAQFRRARELVRARDRVCRMQDRSCAGQLEVHHVVPIEKGGAVADPSNLILLCTSHHRRAEWARRKARGRSDKPRGGLSAGEATKSRLSSSPRNKPNEGPTTAPKSRKKLELEQALQAVKQAEQRLAEARQARAELDRPPAKARRHATRAHQSFEDYLAARDGGTAANPGPDTSEIAGSIRRGFGEP